MAEEKLTDVVLRNAKPSEKARKLFDGGGLYLEVQPSGAKYWRLAEKLMAAITQPMDFAGRALTVGASVGIAVFPDHGDDPEALCRAADRAMYGVKRGRKSAAGFAVGEVG